MSGVLTRAWLVGERTRGVMARIDEAGGEITPEIEAELHAVEADAPAVVLEIARAVQASGDDLAAIDRAMDRLKAAKAVVERRKASLAVAGLSLMRTAGIERVEDPVTPVAVRKNPPSYRWDPDAPPPPELTETKITTSVSAAKLRAAFKAGETYGGKIREVRGERFAVGERRVAVREGGSDGTGEG